MLKKGLNATILVVTLLFTTLSANAKIILASTFTCLNIGSNKDSDHARVNINNGGRSDFIMATLDNTDFTYLISYAMRGTTNYSGSANTLAWGLGIYNLTNGNTISMQYSVRVGVFSEFVNSAEITNSLLSNLRLNPGKWELI